MKNPAIALKRAFTDPTPAHEGRVTKAVESVTAKVPSIGYLTLALASLGVSASLALLFRKRELANFVGLWVPTFMIAGLYNKIVKVHGHDQEDHGIFEMEITERAASIL